MADLAELINQTENITQAITQTQAEYGSILVEGKEFLTAISHLGSSSKNLAMALLTKLMGFFNVTLSPNILGGVAIGVWIIVLCVIWNYAQAYFKYVLGAGVMLILLALLGII